MLDILKKRDNENREQYIWRIGKAIDSGILDSWKSIIKTVCSELGIKQCDESAIRKVYQSAKRFAESGVFTSDETDLDVKIRELKKEKIKVQTANLELNRMTRELARNEMISENIVVAIEHLPSLPIPEKIEDNYGDSEYMLAIADQHFGCEFKILNPVDGSIINEYSPEICFARLNHLKKKVIAKIEALGIKSITIADLGDNIDGILRISQLNKLRYGAIDSTIIYSEFFAKWLSELSEYVKIRYTVVQGNHSQQRILTGKFNDFPSENLNKVFKEFLKLRLSGNPNVEIIDNYNDDYSVISICGYNVLCMHNGGKSADTTMKNLSSIYGTNFNYIVSGHMHHSAQIETGAKSEALMVGSIIGSDEYSMSLQKNSSASAKMFEFTEGEGRTAEYIFRLN